MARLVWDANGSRVFETGVKNGVLYTPKTVEGVVNPYGTATAWNGLTAVSESPEGAEATALYADDIKYLNLISAENFKFSIEAYTYPDAFAACDGTQAIATGAKAFQQNRTRFGFCFKTTVGNDTTDEAGYILHLIYGCLAAPSERSYATVNDSPEAMTFSWDVSTIPVAFTQSSVEYNTAHIEIDSTKCDAEDLAALEAKLYGTQQADGYLPLPSEVVTIFS